MGRCVHVTNNHRTAQLAPGMWVELSREALRKLTLVEPKGVLAQVIWANRTTVDVKMAHNSKLLRVPVEAVLFECQGR